MDVVPYTGLSRDKHRVLKVYAAATDQTIRAIHEEAMIREMARRPGMDAAGTLISAIRDAITEAEQPQQVKE